MIWRLQVMPLVAWAYHGPKAQLQPPCNINNGYLHRPITYKTELTTTLEIRVFQGARILVELEYHWN